MDKSNQILATECSFRAKHFLRAKLFSRVTAFGIFLKTLLFEKTISQRLLSVQNSPNAQIVANLLCLKRVLATFLQNLQFIRYVQKSINKRNFFRLSQDSPARRCSPRPKTLIFNLRLNIYTILKNQNRPTFCMKLKIQISDLGAPRMPRHFGKTKNASLIFPRYFVNSKLVKNMANNVFK